MTTFRRFTCNNLLEIAPVNLSRTHQIEKMKFYMEYMGTWPENCRAAYSPGGIIMGYVMGSSHGMGEDRFGKMSAYVVPEDLSSDLPIRLSLKLEERCRDIYDCYRMIFYEDADNIDGILELQKLGYEMNLLHAQNHIDMVKQLKPTIRPLRNMCRCGNCIVIPAPLLERIGNFHLLRPSSPPPQLRDQPEQQQ